MNLNDPQVTLSLQPALVAARMISIKGVRHGPYLTAAPSLPCGSRKCNATILNFSGPDNG